MLWQETFAFYGKICTIVKKIHGFDAIFFILVGTEMVRFAKEMTFSYCQKYKIPFENCNKRTAKTSPFSLLFMTANIFCSNGCKINHIARIMILFLFCSKTTTLRYRCQFLWDVKTFVAFRCDQFFMYFQLTSEHVYGMCVCVFERALRTIWFCINDFVCSVWFGLVWFGCLNFLLSAFIMLYMKLCILMLPALETHNRWAIRKMMFAIPTREWIKISETHNNCGSFRVWVWV